MQAELTGAALDARFFEVCCGWSRETRQVAEGYLMHFWHQPHVSVGEGEWMRCPPVSTDANCCEAWAMRWARENGLHWRIDQHNDECRVELWRLDGRWYAYGTDYKEAFVRACVAAAQALKTNGEPKHD